MSKLPRRDRASRRGGDVTTRIARPVSGDLGLVLGARVFIGPVVGGVVYEQLGSGTLWTATFALGIGLCLAYLALSVPAARRARAAALEGASGSG